MTDVPFEDTLYCTELGFVPYPTCHSSIGDPPLLLPENRYRTDVCSIVSTPREVGAAGTDEPPIRGNVRLPVPAEAEPKAFRVRPPFTVYVPVPSALWVTKNVPSAIVNVPLLDPFWKLNCIFPLDQRSLLPALLESAQP
jgi:hypothetical protein